MFETDPDLTYPIYTYADKNSSNLYIYNKSEVKIYLNGNLVKTLPASSNTANTYSLASDVEIRVDANNIYITRI